MLKAHNDIESSTFLIDLRKLSEAAEIANSTHKISVDPDQLSNIERWAASIAPGTPAVPSPLRSSFHETPKSTRWPITPSPKPVSPSDLLALGYSQYIVPLPNLRTKSDSLKKRGSEGFTSVPRVRPRTKSFAIEEGTQVKPNRLRSFSFRNPAPHVIASTEMPPPVPPLPTSSKRAARKPKSTPQSRYGPILAPGGGAGAFSLEQEAAFAQMMGGGSQSKNVQRVVDRHAQATGLSNVRARSAKEEVFYGSKDRRPVEKREHGDPRVGGGVSGVYRDEHGLHWWDEDEAMEFAGLLPGDTNSPLRNSTVHNQDKEKRRRLLPRLSTKPSAAHHQQPDNWVSLHSPSSPARTRKGHTDDALRKNSAASVSDVSDTDPDLDPAFAIRPRDSSAFSAAPGFIQGYSLAPERHLYRAPPGIEAFGEVSPLDSNHAPIQARRSKERRRPAPLTLPLPTPHPGPKTASSVSTARANNPEKSHGSLILPAVNQPGTMEREGRDEYFASKFEPDILSSHAPSMQPMAQKAARRGSLTAGFSALNVLGTRGSRRASIGTPSPASSHFSKIQQSNPSNVRQGNVPRPHEHGLKQKGSRLRLTSFFKRA